MNELNGSQAAEVGRRGFVHVPAFLGESELELLRHDFRAVVRKDSKDDYSRAMSLDVLGQIKPRFQSIPKTVQGAAGIEVDGLCVTGEYFPNYEARPDSGPEAPGVKFGWHQDHESYYLWQDHHNYLNLYIPIEKPNPARSNLTVVPFDRLWDRAPKLCEQMFGRGATHLLNGRDGWVVIDDERGRTLGPLGFDPAEIEETPQLSAGDLLLMRGDIIHRTQDTETHRVATSFRMMNGRAPISRKRLARGGRVKAKMMYRNRTSYRAIFGYFRSNQCDTTTIAQMQTYLRGLPAPTTCSRLTFLTLLLSEKCRSVF